MSIAQEELDLFHLPEAAKQRFVVTDRSSLTWALRKLSAIEKEKNEINALAAEEIRRIEDYRERELYKQNESEAFFHSLIEDYMARQREADPEFKKSVTPYGEVGYHKQSPKWNYDDKALLESLKANGLTEFIRVKEEPNKVDLKKCVVVDGGRVVDPNSGDIIEGVTVEEQPDKVVIKL